MWHMRNPSELRDDAMECLRMAEQAKARRHKALLLDLAQAWMLLSEQAQHIKAQHEERSS